MNGLGNLQNVKSMSNKAKVKVIEVKSKTRKTNNQRNA